MHLLKTTMTLGVVGTAYMEIEITAFDTAELHKPTNQLQIHTFCPSRKRLSSALLF